ncbi:MAG TPA: UDP-N-acetylmuramoyl-L-alanine--D-glutamate ligase [Acidimicrobiales bacterium]|nr:UDP-N-acetylmuramoyl-L-alanine--D-glutamate ligase [Acidimicrobiales bacterium]
MASNRILVYGLGVSGRATAATLLSEGVDVVAADDDGGEGPRASAAGLGIDLVTSPDRETLRALARTVDEIVVTPGVPACHRVFSLDTGVPVVGEVELAWRRARAQIVAVTGTNGKTTVTTLVHAMLEASGVKAVAAGNIGLPLLEAVAGDAHVVVAEVSSFQLALTTSFHPVVGAWVNFSPDHQDWHASVDDYRDAKTRLWANSGPGDVAVANLEDPVVMAASALPRARGAEVRTFGLSGGDYTLRGGELVGPGGVPVVEVGELARTMPHDLADALCATSTAIAAGASPEACRRALVAFRGLPHRVELIGEANGVRFYDDSKATTPGAVLAAVEGCAPAVLIAGGRNKGLDLSVLAGAAPRLRGVVAIGEAALEVAAAFEGVTPVSPAPSMGAAVEAALAMADPGDSVVLSPACASFDWYRSYAERGDDFARCVRALPGFRAPTPGAPR